MGRARRTGATAAAALPAALGAALLVSAPFAGTTTAPLAQTHNRADSVTAGSTAAGSTTGHAPSASLPDSGTGFDISPGSIATLAVGELALVGVGAGVLVAARRRRSAED